jgi:hypothetical protein
MINRIKQKIDYYLGYLIGLIVDNGIRAYFDLI